jgi:hypothetical protein
MSDLNVELCPETGICSIIKDRGEKIDLMPEEVEALREASGDDEAIKKALSGVDADFAESLDTSELSQVSARLK